MAELIKCRDCDSPYCNGCNMLTLQKMLNAGKFDYLMDEHRSIVKAPESLRPKGEWVWDENAMDWGLGGWICSKCQEKNDNIPANPDIYPSGWVGSHFCPNCGADMRGEKT